MNYTDLDVRMKENYENRSKNFLTRRVPVIIRIDGKSFHTFCKRFDRPYDRILNYALNNTMEFLCKNIQGAKFAQRHSDEISILVTDYDTITTDAFFDYNVQKICSVVASMASAQFCKTLYIECNDDLNKYLQRDEDWPCFDARCFNLPEEEITNYFWWRVLDAKRNSIQMVGQANFSHKELHGLTCDQIQEKLFIEKQINWAKLPQGQKTGFLCVKTMQRKEVPGGPLKGTFVDRSVWETQESRTTRDHLDSILLFARNV